ncbi:UNVERIFIED_CONTAM: hypothetical protein FKN15_076392 [Acipenser sinensis]
MLFQKLTTVLLILCFTSYTNAEQTCPEVKLVGLNDQERLTFLQGCPGFPGVPGTNGIPGIPGSKGEQGFLGAKGAKNCKELLEQGHTLSGWYTVYTESNKSISVYCDMDTDGGGWLVFQKRMDGSVDFFRDWNSYKRGFGSKLTEFWLGNDNIHLLTETGSHELRIDFEDFDNVKTFAKYQSFKILGESEKYKLVLGEFTGGTAGIKNCKELLEQGHTLSGWYTVYTESSKGISVFCDMDTDGGGWLVFQKRMDGSVDFFRDWNSYKRGFGSKLAEFWLGNDNIHLLTETGSHELRIDFEDFDNVKTFAKYQSFKILGESEKYKLVLGEFTGGTAGDSLGGHIDMPFSTKDQDLSPSHCAETYKGAWWYTNCHYSNLNGLYLKGSHGTYADGVNWSSGKGYNYSYKYTGSHELRIDFEDFDNVKTFAKYQSFKILGESEKYKLVLGEFTGGTAGLSLWGSGGAGLSLSLWGSGGIGLSLWGSGGAGLSLSLWGSGGIGLSLWGSGGAGLSLSLWGSGGIGLSLWGSGGAGLSLSLWGSGGIGLSLWGSGGAGLSLSLWGSGGIGLSLWGSGGAGLSLSLWGSGGIGLSLWGSGGAGLSLSLWGSGGIGLSLWGSGGAGLSLWGSGGVGLTLWDSGGMRYSLSDSAGQSLPGGGRYSFAGVAVQYSPSNSDCKLSGGDCGLWYSLPPIFNKTMFIA